MRLGSLFPFSRICVRDKAMRLDVRSKMKLDDPEASSGPGEEESDKIKNVGAMGRFLRSGSLVLEDFVDHAVVRVDHLDSALGDDVLLAVTILD
jgi:hypothetical protein